MAYEFPKKPVFHPAQQSPQLVFAQQLQPSVTLNFGNKLLQMHTKDGPVTVQIPAGITRESLDLVIRLLELQRETFPEVGGKP